MPTYHVTSSSGSLSRERKARIAEAITRVHGEVTGAPGYLAQVIFIEVAPGDYFIAGMALEEDQVFVHGQIRAGRDDETKRRLLDELVAATARAGQLPGHQVWVYLSELPPEQMAEFGHRLPPAGKEQAWFKALPAGLQQRLKVLRR